MKMIRFFQQLVVFGALVTGVQSRAQVDATTGLLIRPTGSAAEGPNLDSSRYTVKPAAPAAPRAVKSTTTEVVKKEAPAPAVVAAPVAAPPAAPSAAPSTSPEPTKNVIEDIRAALLGGDEESMNKYLEQLHPQDPRQNLVNLSVGAGYLYQDSRSTSWFRDFHSDGPGLPVDADIWFSPMLGFGLGYFTTLSADVRAEPTSQKNILADHRNMDVGFQFRKYTSMSRKSPSIILGVQYSEYQMIVPKEESYRARLKSTGVGFSAAAQIPKTNNMAWTFGADLFPKLKVLEEKTAAEIKSGSDATTYGFKFTVGQLYTIDRSSQIFWRLSHRVDKSVYEGASAPNDPVQGVALEGLSVTSGTSLFEVGYTWGD